MATNHTSNYQLNQWEPTDQVLHTDFNEDNAKIDAALKSLNTTVQQHTTQLTQQTAAIAKCGNCQLYYTSYTGNGQYTRTIAFPHKPTFVLLLGSKYTQMYFVIEGASKTLLDGYGATVSWNGANLTLSMPETSNPGFNDLNCPVYVMALIQTDK